MTEFLKKCNVKYHGNIISKETVIMAFEKFYVEANDYYDQQKHETLVFHSGSDCFDVMAIVIAAVNCLDDNDLTPEEIIENLVVDRSLVIFANQKYKYKGIVDNVKESCKYVHLYYETIHKKIKTEHRTYVPLNERATGIIPYGEIDDDGTEVSFRGARRISPARKSFFTNVFGYKKDFIPANTNKSVLIVMSKNKFLETVKNISITFRVNNSEVEAKLLDLVTAVYYSESANDESVGSSYSQTYPVLIGVKDTATATAVLSVAASEETSYHVNGVYISGSDIIEKGMTYFDSIFDKSFLKYWTVSTNINYYNSELLLDKYENAKVFSCSRHYLKNTDYKIVEDNIVTDQLFKQLNLLANKKDVEFVTVESAFTKEICFRLNRNIGTVQKHEGLNLTKQDFIMDAYKLFSVLRNLICSVNKQNEMIYKNILTYVPAETILKRVKDNSLKLNEEVRETAEMIANDLETLFKSVKESNSKEQAVKEFLRANSDKKIAVIAPKSNYDLVMRETGYYALMDTDDNLTVTNSSRFNSNEIYDIVLMLGYSFSKKFSIYNCNNAGKVIVLGYEYDIAKFRYLEHKSRNTERKLHKRSDSDYKENDTSDFYENDITDSETREIELQLDTDKSIKDFILQYESTTLFGGISAQRQYEKTTTICNYIATFEDSDEKAFLTEHYSAYVLDIYSEEESAITEKEARDLKEGDVVIFTRYTEETRDIVDLIMKKRINEGKYGPEITKEYERSQRWRKTLLNGLKKSGNNKARFAEHILKFKPGVQKQAIIRWMYEDSHIVHPQNSIAFKSIGMACADEELRKNSEEYFASCQNIQRLRHSVLHDLGEALRARASGKPLAQNSDLRDVYDRRDNIVSVLTINKFVSVEPQEIPAGMANKPLDL